MNTKRSATTEQELLEHYAAIAHDKQLDLEQVVGDNSWNVDLTAGTISFGPTLVFPLQVLGSFSHESETWLWVWQNEQSDIPELLQQQALALRAYGEQHNISLLTVGQFNASQEDLLLIGSVASGMLGASAYYLGNYGAGTILLTVESEQLAHLPKTDFARIPRVLSEVISGYEMQHRPAVLHYLAQKGYSVTEDTNSIRSTIDTGTLLFLFDDLGRLTKMTAESE